MRMLDGKFNIPGRMDVIREHKGLGGTIAAVLPIHYARGLLRAFDILPVEVWGPPRVDSSTASAHLQAYICSIVHNALSFLQGGGLDVTDMLLIPHACDSLQGLGSILTDFIQPKQPVLTLYLPRGRRNGDVDFLADELRCLYADLESLTAHSPSESELMEAIQREETADELSAELHRQRLNLPLTDEAFYRLLRSREYLPAERYIPLAREVLQGRKEPEEAYKPLLLSGIVPEPMDLFTAIAELGGIVAGDDLACCSRRLYPPGVSEDPFRRMAERMVNGPPDSTRGSSISQRLDHLLVLAEDSGARGVIFYVVKFCEPELFDLPSLRKGLQAADLPSLVIEVDISEQLSERVLTRLGAFMEMIS